MRPTRRSFLKLALAGGAALLTTSHGTIVQAATAATTAASRKRTPGAAGVERDALAPDMRKEIDSQITAMGKSLATVRKFQLAPGSPPAFVFRPLRAKRKGTK